MKQCQHCAFRKHSRDVYVPQILDRASHIECMCSMMTDGLIAALNGIVREVDFVVAEGRGRMSDLWRILVKQQHGNLTLQSTKSTMVFLPTHVTSGEHGE